MMASSFFSSVPATIWQINERAHFNGSFFIIRSQSISNFSTLKREEKKEEMSVKSMPHCIPSGRVKSLFNSMALIVIAMMDCLMSVTPKETTKIAAKRI